MEYTATSERKLLLFFVFTGLLLSFLSWDFPSLKFVFLMTATFCLLSVFVKYTLLIKKHKVSYIVQLFGLTLYHKQIVSTDIKKIIFKRIGWKLKLAVIKVHKELPIRVALFKPERVYDDLIVFCEENEIHYDKTKDYKIIEKMG